MDVEVLVRCVASVLLNENPQRTDDALSGRRWVGDSLSGASGRHVASSLAFHTRGLSQHVSRHPAHRRTAYARHTRSVHVSGLQT